MNEYIQYLLDYKHRYTEEQLAKLRKEDIEELYKLFTSGKAGVYEKKVIQILAAAAPDLIRKDLLNRVADERQPEQIRLQSAASLNTIYDKKTEATYLKTLSSPNLPPTLQLKLIKGLGKFGTAKSLDWLTEWKPAPRAQQLATLAKILISARQKRPFSLTFDLDPALPYPDDRQRESIKTVIKDSLKLPPADQYGIEPGDRGYYYECGRSNYAILPAKTIAAKTGPVPQLAGLIAVQSLYDDTYLTNMLIVLLPGEKETAQLLVFRTDGVLAYGGLLQQDGSFALVTQKRFAGDQVFLRGKWEKGRLVFDEFTSSRQVSGKKRPAPLSFR